jgi:hypothetical protein
VGDKFHLKLNTNEIPIAYKYREGKMKRTLERELKGTEIAEREAEGLGCLVVLDSWQAFMEAVRLLEFCDDSGSAYSY